ncbi:hypothetical protein [Nocardiopsis suaedae]|uniref:DUF3072 domain-containing protein n=1 Tax=Nocardiopsis suaedae TaxID=3018444 RepID=A0ABT4TH42_9ACTN|nr:hypothetical protein [Nocardiopsis suaedae]MDA2803584.1 hypothetical protein [Nocardiopsis suaedae]
MSDARTPYRDTDPETIKAAYASYGRMMRGAPPPSGSATFHAHSAEDLLRQLNEHLGLPRPDSDEAPPDAASGHVRAPR